MRSRPSLHLFLYLCSGLGMAFASHCFLHSVCMSEPILSSVALSTIPQSEIMLTCIGTPGASVTSVSWFFTRLVSPMEQEEVQIDLDDSKFTTSGSSAQELTFRNVSGEYEAEYSCSLTFSDGSMTRQPLRCLIVQGRAYFQNCSSGTSEPDGSCSGTENIVATIGQEARLDMRVVFRDGGICENQTIRGLEVKHNDISIYNCSNIFNNDTEPCFSTGKYRVDNSQCPSDCVAINPMECCKFRFFFIVRDVNVNDTGRYVVSVEVQNDGNVRRDITKTFYLQQSIDPHPPDATSTSGSTARIGPTSPGMGTAEQMTGENVAGIVAGVVVVVVILLMAISILVVLLILYCWHKKIGLWTTRRDDKTAYINAADFVDEERDQFDMNSTASGMTKMSLQSRKEKASSVVGPDLGFDLPAGRDSEELRI